MRPTRIKESHVVPKCSLWQAYDKTRLRRGQGSKYVKVRFRRVMFLVSFLRRRRLVDETKSRVLELKREFNNNHENMEELKHKFLVSQLKEEPPACRIFLRQGKVSHSNFLKILRNRISRTSKGQAYLSDPRARTIAERTRERRLC